MRKLTLINKEKTFTKTSQQACDSRFLRKQENIVYIVKSPKKFAFLKTCI